MHEPPPLDGYSGPHRFDDPERPSILREAVGRPEAYDPRNTARMPPPARAQAARTRLRGASIPSPWSRAVHPSPTDPGTLAVEESGTGR